MYKPLFLTGTARGGTNLVKWILERSTKISLESEPYLPLYTSFRNAALEKFVKFKNIKFKNSSPLDDYYYMDSKIEIMEKIQKTRLTLDYKTKRYVYSIANRKYGVSFKCSIFATITLAGKKLDTLLVFKGDEEAFSEMESMEELEIC